MTDLLDSGVFERFCRELQVSKGNEIYLPMADFKDWLREYREEIRSPEEIANASAQSDFS